MYQLQKVSDSAENLLKQPVHKERLVADWYRNVQVAVRRTTAVVKSSDTSLAAFFAENAKETQSSSSALMKEIESLLSTEDEKQLFAQITELRSKYSKERDSIVKSKAQGDSDSAAAAFESSYLPATKRYEAAIADMAKLQRASIDQGTNELRAVAERSQYLLGLLSVLMLLLGAAVSLLISRSITKPLTTAVGLANRVAEGDLTANIEVRSTDEVGQLLQALLTMNSNLEAVVRDVKVGATTITLASQQIAEGNHDLSSRTEQQASALEETAASLEELTSTVRHNADNAQEAHQQAIFASDVAVKGGGVVNKVVDTMESINTASHKIVDIISVIDGIAFQTNILALNAAVEAARAGEQGRGFAVVATEVRSLAQRSAEAAKQIKVLIHDSVDKVATGSDLVHQAGKTMTEVVASVQRVTTIMSEIQKAGREQSVGIEQVNQAVAQMDQTTMQNAALVEETAAVASSMQEQVTALQHRVNTFKVKE